jgi:hypothetical protein
LLTLLQHGVLPVINENDTVVNDEIKFGDNDTLGALVANLVDADALIILTDQKGLYSADPRRDPAATFVHQARAGDPKLEDMAGGAGSSLGKGGMITKILAAKRAAGSGASTVIAWGRETDVLLRLAHGEAIGTLLVAPTQKQQARKQWMVDHLQLRGSVTIDDGQIVVLGGLITDAYTDNTEKVPLVGDLPLLGGLFRYDTRQRAKTNLMVFIKPRILRDAAATTYETNQKYNYIREQQRVLGPRGEVLPLLPGEKPQMLPPLPEPAPAPVAAPVAAPAAAPAEARPPADPSR